MFLQNLVSTTNIPPTTALPCLCALETCVMLMHVMAHRQTRSSGLSWFALVNNIMNDVMRDRSADHSSEDRDLRKCDHAALPEDQMVEL